MDSKKIQITLKKSSYGRKPSHRECLKGLGFKKTNSKVVLERTPEIDGMINKVTYLLDIKEL